MEYRRNSLIHLLAHTERSFQKEIIDFKTNVCYCLAHDIYIYKSTRSKHNNNHL